MDLDATKLISPTGNDQDLPPLPEPEGTVLKSHLKQVLHLTYYAIECHLCVHIIHFYLLRTNHIIYLITTVPTKVSGAGICFIRR